MVSVRDDAAFAAVGQRQTPATGRFILLLAVLLLFGVAVRAPFLPRLGHAYDQDAYRSWMGAIQDHGLGQVFTRTDTDYVGYHYILWALETVYKGDATTATVRDKPLRVLLKIPGLLGDLLTAVLVAIVARSLVAAGDPPGAGWRRAARRLRLSVPDTVGLTSAALFLFHPAVIYAGAYWGQQDSLVSFFMLLACWLAWRRYPAWAGATLALGVIVKPQPLVLVPILAWVVWRPCAWSGLLRGGLMGATVLAAGHAYFIATGNGRRVWDIYTFQLTQNEHLSFGAYNLWWPFERLAGARPDSAVLLSGSPISFGVLASALVLGALALTWRRLWHMSAASLLLGTGFWLAAYYLVAAGSHERYALPALPFLLAALAAARGLRWPLLAYSVALSANLLVALPLDRRWGQGDPVWLTIVISGIAVAAVAWLGWVVLRERHYADPHRPCSPSLDSGRADSERETPA